MTRAIGFFAFSTTTTHVSRSRGNLAPIARPLSIARPHDARARARLHRDAVVLTHAALALGAIEPAPLLLLPLLGMHLATLLREALLGVELLLVLVVGGGRGGREPAHAVRARGGAEDHAR